MFLTRFRTYKIATQPQTKTSVKTTFRDWSLHSSFTHVPIPPFLQPCQPMVVYITFPPLGKAANLFSYFVYRLTLVFGRPLS
jgi:hypothetical protein